MDYSVFKLKNDYNKTILVGNKCGRVLSADLKNNSCVVELGAKKNNIAINDLIILIMRGNGCISNPSIFSNYNFSKYFNNSVKRKNIIADRKKQQIEVESKSIEYRNSLIHCENLLYHGSESGIVGAISCNKNIGVCDFGNGFYTGDCIEQAENRVSNKLDSVIYAYSLDVTNDCSVYEFNDDVLWALFVGYNRGYLSKCPNEYLKKFKFINSHDIIVGYIADDKISDSFKAFLDGFITDKCLTECLKLISYGKQYTFKTTKALKCLQLKGSYKMTKQMKKDSLSWGISLRSDMLSSMDALKIKYRRSGKYIDEYLGGI